MKTSFIITIVILLVGAGIYVFLFQKPPQVPLENQISRPPCLGDDEIVDYEIEKKISGGGVAKIFIRDKNTNEEIFDFQIEISNPNHSHPIEIHKCGVYAIRTFGYDYQKKLPLQNYKRELWVYGYNGNGKALITDTAIWSYENILGDFRVDPTETYVVLEENYLGHSDYALVIKDLKIKEDVFVLKYDDLINKYSAPEGGLALGGWRDDGKYFNGIIHVAARTLAFFHIEVDTWKTEVFIVPAEASIVSTISESGEYITYDNGPGWIAIHETAEQIYEEWRKEGKKVSLFIYNLFTKEKITLAIVDDPGWDFKTKWISDTELEYYLPDGERKTYKIIQ